MPQLSREEIAKLEIGRTEIRPPMAWTLVVAFLATLIAVPTIQIVHELRSRRAGLSETTWPSSFRIFSILSGVSRAFTGANGGRLNKVVTANDRLMKNIHEFEAQLEDASWLADRVRPPTQYLLTRWGGAGNEKAYVGRDGWLFYRPGIDYLTGPGFLDSRTLARRVAAGKAGVPPVQPDPRRAILDFHRQLARRGIQLVLMPTPVKPMLEPERFSSRFNSRPEMLQNVSYAPFKSELEKEGVLIFDPAAAVEERKNATRQSQYLKTDTHWNPTAMQFAARQLHTFIDRKVSLPAASQPGYGSRAVDISHLGDIAVMMQLPREQSLYRPQTVTVRQIVQSDGELWQPDPSSDLLLLGDSFTNIFSLSGMHWGEAAGLAEQLSFVMQRPIDRIAQNDAGAFATRQALALELARGNDRLAGKRVVVWQFAMSELADGDWKMFSLHEPPPGSSRNDDPSGDAPVVVKGRVVAAAGLPQPGTVPYREAVIAVHLTDLTKIRGKVTGHEAVVYLWGMRDNRLTPAARFVPGRRVTLKLTPWEQAQRQYGRFARVELDDPDLALIDLPTYWGEEVQ